MNVWDEITELMLKVALNTITLHSPPKYIII